MARPVEKRVSFDRDKRALLALVTALSYDDLMGNEWRARAVDLANELAGLLAQHEARRLAPKGMH